MSTPTDQDREAAEKFAKANFTEGTFAYADAKLSFKAGIEHGRKERKSKRGKWSRDKWIRILELLSEMTPEERQRCLRATVAFWGKP